MSAPAARQLLVGSGWLHASWVEPCFPDVLRRTKSHSPFLGLAWSLLGPSRLREGWVRPVGFLPYAVTHSQKSIWINKSLYSGWFVFVYLGVSYDLCFWDPFGIEGCWCVRFTHSRVLTSVTRWWQAEGRNKTDGTCVRVGLQCRCRPISLSCSEAF